MDPLPAIPPELRPLLEWLENRFERIENRFERIEKKLERLDVKMDAIYPIFK